jgi:hypothetical protein
MILKAACATTPHAIEAFVSIAQHNCPAQFPSVDIAGTRARRVVGYACTGCRDVRALGTACTAVLHRQGILRTSSRPARVHRLPQETRQQHAPALCFVPETVPLSEVVDPVLVHEIASGLELRRFIDRIRGEEIDHTSVPIIRFHLCRLPRQVVLLIRTSRAVIDRWSLRLIAKRHRGEL